MGAGIVSVAISCVIDGSQQAGVGLAIRLRPTTHGSASDTGQASDRQPVKDRRSSGRGRPAQRDWPARSIAIRVQPSSASRRTGTSPYRQIRRTVRGCVPRVEVSSLSSPQFLGISDDTAAAFGQMSKSHRQSPPLLLNDVTEHERRSGAGRGRFCKLLDRDRNSPLKRRSQFRQEGVRQEGVRQEGVRFRQGHFEDGIFLPVGRVP